MVWHSYLIKNIPQFVLIHTVLGISIVNEPEVDVFLGFPFSVIPTGVGSLISDSSAYSKIQLVQLEVLGSCTAAA